MKTLLLAIFTLVFAFMLPVHSAATESILPAELDRVLRDYEAGWAAGDAAALAALFAEDGWVLSPGAPAIYGRANIEGRYEGSGGPLSLSVLEFRISGDLAIILGEYSVAAGSPAVGKFTLTLTRILDRWFILSDMDNSVR